MSKVMPEEAQNLLAELDIPDSSANNRPDEATAPSVGECKSGIVPELISSEQSTTARFDYSALNADVAAMARDAAERIRTNCKKAAEGIIAAGHYLLKVKDRLEHGQWLRWLHSEFSFSERTARNWMNAAERLGAKSAIVSDLPPTTIYKLSAPSTSSTLREEILSSLESCQKASSAEIEERLRKNDSAPKGRRPTSHSDAKAHRRTKSRATEVAATTSAPDQAAAKQRAAALITECVGELMTELLQLMNTAGSITALDLEAANATGSMH